MTTTNDVTVFDPVEKLGRAAESAAMGMDRTSARTLVDMYYRWQRHRIDLKGQFRAQIQGADGDDASPSLEVIDYFASQSEALEKRAASVLGKWAAKRPEGEWAQAQLGIGPVISAGLSAHIDITKAPTVGHIWRFAGLDPTVKWLGQKGARELLGRVMDDESDEFDTEYSDTGALSDDELAQLDAELSDGHRHELDTDQIALVSRLTGRKFQNLIRLARNDSGRITRTSMLSALAKRPWNASLKVLCWKAGQSFIKVSNNPNAFYGVIYRQRKELEIERNEAGVFADQAAATLKERNIRDADLKATYEAGRLPAGRLDLRAQRYATKLFLAGWHEVAYVAQYGQLPPLPYALEHLGHTHEVVGPDFPDEVVRLRAEAGRPLQ